MYLDFSGLSPHLAPYMASSVQVESSRVSLRSYIRLVRGNRNFRRLWMAQIVSEIGDWFYCLAIYALLLQLTGKASSVAIALVVQVLPQTFIGPTAGVVNDRISRKRVMITTDLVRCAIVLSMLLVRSASAVWLIYPLLLAETLAAAFFEPARTSVIPNIAAPEDLVLANTLSSTTWSMNLVLGAALGGIASALLGRDAVFILNALSFVASASLIAGMKFAEPHTAHAEPFHVRELATIAPILEGIRYVRREKRLLASMLAKAGIFVIGPSWVIFTVMGRRDFPVHWHDLDPQRGAMLGMSLLMGARGLGAFIGPLAVAPWAGHDQRRLRLAILLGYVAEGAGYFALGTAASLPVACAWIVLAHFGGSIIWVFSTTLLQLTTDDRFRGRVFAADTSFAMLNLAVGAFLAGRFMDLGYSARSVASVTGLLMLFPTLAWAWFTLSKTDSAELPVEADPAA